MYIITINLNRALNTHFGHIESHKKSIRPYGILTKRSLVYGFTDNGLRWNIAQLWKSYFLHYNWDFEISFRRCVSSLLSTHYNAFLLQAPSISPKPRAFNHIFFRALLFFWFLKNIALISKSTILYSLILKGRTCKMLKYNYSNQKIVLHNKITLAKLIFFLIGYLSHLLSRIN